MTNRQRSRVRLKLQSTVGCRGKRLWLVSGLHSISLLKTTFIFNLCNLVTKFSVRPQSESDLSNKILLTVTLQELICTYVVFVKNSMKLKAWLYCISCAFFFSALFLLYTINSAGGTYLHCFQQRFCFSTFYFFVELERNIENTYVTWKSLLLTYWLISWDFVGE